jgi:hypothetical protein
MLLICKQCGNEFKSEHKGKKYCTMKCYGDAQKGNPAYPNIVNKRGIKPRKRTISVCIVCGKSFEHKSYRKAKYCSKLCWSHRNPKEMIECLYCGKEYWTYDKTRKYCSKKCSDKHHGELSSGVNSHLWRGGKTSLNKLERSRAKYNEWRNKVFQRDRYTCCKCGITGGHGKAVFLNAHHIKSFSEHPESRYDISNGITLCKNCHLLEHHHKF